MPNHLVIFPQTELYDAELAMLDEEPEGFFPIDRTSNWGALRQVIASILQEPINQLSFIENESDPETSLEYLADWETMLKLSIDAEIEGTANRRTAILAALNQQGFTKTRLRNIVESYLENQVGTGLPAQFTSSGIAIGSGIPLTSGITDIENTYVITEDTDGLEITTRILDSVTMPQSFFRAMARLAPAGITLTNSFVANPGVSSNLFDEPEFDDLTTLFESSDGSSSGWNELSQQQVYEGTNSLKTFYKDSNPSAPLRTVGILGPFTFANSLCEIKFRIWIPSAWPTGHMSVVAKDFSNNFINVSSSIDFQKRDQWQTYIGHWNPGSDNTGTIQIVYDGNNIPAGFDSYITDGSMEDSSIANWDTGGTNILASVTGITAFKGTRSLRCQYADSDLLLEQEFSLDTNNSLTEQIWYARVRIASAANPTKLSLQVRDFGIETLIAEKEADVSLKDQWQTLKLQWIPPPSTVSDLAGRIVIQSEGLSSGDRIFFDAFSANSTPDLFVYVDDVSLGVLA